MKGEVLKRMFFGNYKPRLLVLSLNNDRLMLAYKYVDTFVTKRALSLGVRDYAETENDSDFMVRSEDTKYFFKVL